MVVQKYFRVGDSAATGMESGPRPARADPFDDA